MELVIKNVCADCGEEWGYSSGNLAPPKYDFATCDICGRPNRLCCEPMYYGYVPMYSMFNGAIVSDKAYQNVTKYQAARRV